MTWMNNIKNLPMTDLLRKVENRDGWRLFARSMANPPSEDGCSQEKIDQQNMSNAIDRHHYSLRNDAAI